MASGQIQFHESILDAVGNTPLLRLRGISRGTPAGIVRRDGKSIGILSRYDFLDYLPQRR